MTIDTKQAIDYWRLREQLDWKRRQTVLVTPSKECSACWERRMHTPEERRKFHPLAGTGSKDTRI